MEADLFAGLAVTDLSASLPWYEQLFGAAPAFFPNDREAVFEVAPRGYVYVALDPARAGHALVTLRQLVDLDDPEIMDWAWRCGEPLTNTLGR